MFRIWPTPALLAALSACAMHNESAAFPQVMAATEVPAARPQTQTASLYIAPEITALEAPFRYAEASQGLTIECTATIVAGPPLESAIDNVTRTAYPGVTRGGGLAQPLLGVDRHIAVQLDSLTLAPPVLGVGTGHIDAEADVDLRLRVSVYDGGGRLLLRRPLAATGHGEIKPARSKGCKLAGDIEAKAIEDAIRNVMRAYAGNVLDAPELAPAATD